MHNDFCHQPHISLCILWMLDVHSMFVDSVGPLFVLQLAFDIYGRLKKSGQQLTLHTYHTVLRGSTYLKAEGVQELYAEMRSRQDLAFKDKTFAYVLRAAANCGGGIAASWIIQV